MPVCDGPHDSFEETHSSFSNHNGGKGFTSKSMHWRGRVLCARIVFGDDPVRLSLCGDGSGSALLPCFLPLICREDATERGTGCVTRRGRDGAGLNFNGLSTGRANRGRTGVFSDSLRFCALAVLGPSMCLLAWVRQRESMNGMLLIVTH